MHTFYAQLINRKKKRAFSPQIFDTIDTTAMQRSFVKMVPLIYSYSFVAFISRSKSLSLAALLLKFPIEISRFDCSLLVFLSHWNLIEIALLGVSCYYPPTGLAGSRRLSPRHFKTGAMTRHSLIRFVCREFVGERIFHSPETANVASHISMSDIREWARWNRCSRKISISSLPRRSAAFFPKLINFLNIFL